MKKLIYIILVLGLAACDKELNIKPTQSIDEVNALATAQDVKVTLIGAYDGFTDNDVMGGGFAYTGELLADEREVIFGGTFTTLDEMWNKSLTAGNTQILATWRDAYIAINRANNVLSALDKLTATDKNQVEGEARFIRGSVYFGLVGLFGKAWGDGDNNTNLAVPVVTAPTRAVTDQDNRPRASVAAVYTQIIEDLTKAESLLPDAAENKSFATRDAATALLARIYLIQGNFAAARDAANKVINSGHQELSATFEEIFDDQSEGFSSEVIFGTFINEQDGINSMNTYYAPAAFAGRGDIRVQNKHIALYDADDPRGKFFTTASNRLFTNKFNDQFGDVPVIRLAEMYLIRAETNFRLNTNIGAQPLEDINTIRTRAGAQPLAANAITLDKIIAERKLELAFEGLALSDVKRLKKSVGTLPFSDPKLVCPIPQREIDTNKSLTQNPGY